MDFSPEISTLESAISEMQHILRLPLEKLSEKRIKGLVTQMDKILEDVYYIDDLMPLEEFADKFDNEADKDEFFRVLDLLDIAFGLIDQIVGPPEEYEDEPWDNQEPAPEPVLDERQKAIKKMMEDDSEAPEDPFAELLKSIKPNRHTS